ncbi:membrane-associated tyrosine- and threonine-specific cdc2-inhibitory kinase-like [Huso huso]
MPVPPEPELACTPIPVPAFFKEAECSFSLKKRRQPACSNSCSVLSRSLPPPRPPAKGVPPLSRLFPNRERSWSQPRPRGVSFREPPERPLSSSHYDESKGETYFQQCFQCLSKLGRGSFGEVYKVRSREDGRYYAVKRSMDRFRGDGDRQRKLQEVRKHERLPPHPNCVGFQRAWEEGGRLYIQTELCRGSLQQHCEAQAEPAGEAQVWAFLWDLLCALGHLHRHGLLHMDVKPANAFLSPAGRCKLGDFGLVLELGEGERGEGQEGDPRYMAPELLRGVYTPAADVFSLGLTILELACNMELPSGGEGWQQLRQGYLPPEFTSGLSPELLSVLRVMLHPDPSHRASVSQLCSLAALRRVRWRRSLSLAVREALSRMLSLFQWLVSLLCGVWLSLAPLPLRWAGLTRAGTPPLTDSSSSDLEPDSVGDEVFQLPSLLSLQTDGSPSRLRGGVCSPSLRGRLSLGSTSTPRRLSPHSTSSSSSSSKRSGDCTPNVSGISDACCSPCTLILASSSSPSTVSPQPAPPRPGFEPRNLLSLFEEVSLEQQE